MKRDANFKKAINELRYKHIYENLIKAISDESYVNGYNHVLQAAQSSLNKEEYERLKNELKKY